MSKTENIKKILYNNKEIAYIVRAQFPIDNLDFFSKKEDYLQVGYHKKPKGAKLKAHYHCFQKCSVDSLQEVFYIVKGKVKVNFYNKQGKLFQTEILKKGDILFQRSLGHSFELLTQAEIFEVKQGPFLGSVQKKYYSP
jgi:cupin superfamily acireductone dioxygenase involved in methionine salvage